MLSLTLMRRFRATSAETPTIEALESLCRREVYRYALRRLEHHQDAEDIAAEVYIVALEARATLGGSIALRPWLLGIARRKVADQLRRRTRHPQTSLSDIQHSETSGPETDALRAEATLRMRQLVLALPVPQREALLLQAADGLSIIEIAQVMHRSPSAINSLLGRARETIRRSGGDYFEEKTQ